MWASGKKESEASGFTSNAKISRVTTAQSINTTAWTVVQFNNKVYDQNDETDVSSLYRWTCKEAGYYSLKAMLTMTGLSGNEGLSGQFYLNGGGISVGDSLGVGSTQLATWVSFATDMYIEKDEYIQVGVYHNGAAARALAAGSCLSIHRYK